MPYIEAVRQLRYELGANNSLVVHLTLIPYMAASGELQDQADQHSVKQLLENGLQPDALVLRTEKHLTNDIRRKVALFLQRGRQCGRRIDRRTDDLRSAADDAGTVKLDLVVLDKLRLPDNGEPDLKAWIEFVEKVKHPQKKVNIALVGKYTELPDAYKSIVESFIHAGAANHTKVKLQYVNSEKITKENIAAQLKGMCGILVTPVSGTAASKEKSKRCVTPANRKSRSSGSALECSAA